MAWEWALSSDRPRDLLSAMRRPFQKRSMKSVLPPRLPHRLLEAGDGAAAFAEDVEELVPKRLRIAALAGGVAEVAAKGDGALADLVPTQGHGG